LQATSGRADGRLRKRYETPVRNPPDPLKMYVVAVVTRRAFLFRGVDPSSKQFQEITADASAAEADLKETADGEHGLWDLPIRTNSQASGVTKGGTRVYSAASPYVGNDEQRCAASSEDASGTGTVQ
jgi:hypothetical protein